MVTFETLNQFISAHKIIALKITLSSCQARSPMYCAEGLFAVLQLQWSLNCILKLCIHLFHTVPSVTRIKVWGLVVVFFSITTNPAISYNMRLFILYYPWRRNQDQAGKLSVSRTYRELSQCDTHRQQSPPATRQHSQSLPTCNPCFSLSLEILGRPWARVCVAWPGGSSMAKSDSSARSETKLPQLCEHTRLCLIHHTPS